MKLKLLSLFFLFLIFTSFTDSHLKIPKQFAIKQKSFSLITTFYLEADESAFGKIVKETSSSQTVFHYKDIKDHLIGKGKIHFIEKGAIINVYDENDQLLGLIKQETFTFMPAKYKVYDSYNSLVAVGEMNWLGSRFSLYDPSNAYREYIQFSRPYFKLFNDHWYVKIIHENALDPRFIILLAAYQTDIDNKNTELGKKTIN